MKSLFRYREADDNTLSELSTPYLWFSTREGFNDKQDANNSEVFNNNPDIQCELKKIVGNDNFKKYIEELNKTGICCFTPSLIKENALCHFPRHKQIAIEYDTCELLRYLVVDVHIQIRNFFKRVTYSKKTDC